MRVDVNDFKKIFNTVMGASFPITEETKRDDVEQWDSLNHLNLIIELQDFYKIEFTPEEMSKMNSVKEIIKIIEGK